MKHLLTLNLMKINKLVLLFQKKLATKKIMHFLASKE
jgi:hypothetical protein